MPSADDSMDTSVIHNCGKCDDIVTDTKCIGCDGRCEKWFHSKCVGMKISDVQVLGSIKGVKWFCDVCEKEQFSLLARMTESVDKLKSDFENSMSASLEKFKVDLFKKWENRGTLNVNSSFAAAVRDTKREPAIIVKSVSKQNVAQSKDEIKENVDIIELDVGVSDMRGGKDGSVIIECENDEGRDKLKKKSRTLLVTNIKFSFRKLNFLESE